VLEKTRIDADAIPRWFPAVLRPQTKDAQAHSRPQRAELQRQTALAENQQDPLVDVRLNEEIDSDVFAKKQCELRDRIAELTLK